MFTITTTQTSNKAGAGIIIANHEANASAEIRTLAYRLADEFKVQNPRFDRDRFLKACGL